MLATCVVLLVLGACGADGESPSAGAGQGRQTPPTSSTAPPADDQGGDADPDDGTDVDEGGEAEPTPDHADPVAVAEPYEPLPDEVRPDAKRLAARVVESLTTYEVDESPEDIVARLAEGELAGDLLRDAEPLLHDDAWSRGEVVYPQLGGMLDDATSVMVAVEQTVGLADGTVLEQTRTLDVRLTLRGSGWALDGLASAGGRPVERPDDLPAVAITVLEDERIELPDSAVWDIHRGAVDEELLALMARMADRAPYGVLVLDTGHPWEVFGTDRQSKHTAGQAVDVHRLGPDGPLVIEDRTRDSTARGLVEWLYEQPELSEVGSPWSLDGYGGRSFTDLLHQDHIHIGVGGR